ncbi:hypothetical protein ACE1BU_02540 [Aeromonas veronii]|uniref:hypothetical protein n=1 Tax=Aeromonas veronii TaxID=654 RepID=UPI0035B936F5
MIDIPASGSSTGSFNASLPRPPRKAARNIADVTATFPAGITAGSNGKWSFTYHFWDVSSVVANCRFGIAGGSAPWDSSAVMALRNDLSAQTVWTKAYSTLGTSCPHAGCFDLVGGFFYVFTSTATELRLWKIRLSDGNATLVASDTGVKCPNFGYAIGQPAAMLCRFVSSDTIELIYYKNAAFHICYRTVVNLSSLSFSSATEFNAMGYLAPTESFTSPSSFNNSSVQYVTKDGRASLAFTPSGLLDVPVNGTSSNGGDRGSIRAVVVTRGLARCTLSINDNGYHIPYRADLPSANVSQVMMTDNLGAISLLKEKTQYVPGWDGRFDFYDQSDLDRWVHQIADEAGLPVSSPWW